MVSGHYQWYAPMFVNRVKKAYPEYDIKVFVRGKCELPPDMRDGIIDNVFNDYDMNGYTTASLRFVEGEECLEDYDYVLITDIDIMIKRENPSLLEQRLMRMKMNELDCYENYISTNASDRLPGVHFVTKDWWNKTRIARNKYMDIIRKHGVSDYDYDEKMLYNIVCESNLFKASTLPHLWNHHGVHLGTWRNKKSKIISSSDKIYLQTLFKDDIFIDIVKKCSEKNNEIKNIFEFLKSTVIGD